MHNSFVEQAIDQYFNECYQHTKQAIIDNKGEYTSDNPFSILMGKMVECIYYVSWVTSKPNFDLDGKDGGVDLIKDSKHISVKMRVLPYSKETYLNAENYVFGKQFDEAYKIAKSLQLQTKCDYVVGVIRYQSPAYYTWQEAWEQNDVNYLKLITRDIFENECIWFSTKSGNVIFDC